MFLKYKINFLSKNYNWDKQVDRSGDNFFLCENYNFWSIGYVSWVVRFLALARLPLTQTQLRSTLALTNRRLGRGWRNVGETRAWARTNPLIADSETLRMIRTNILVWTVMGVVRTAGSTALNHQTSSILPSEEANHSAQAADGNGESFQNQPPRPTFNKLSNFY